MGEKSPDRSSSPYLRTYVGILVHICQIFFCRRRMMLKALEKCGTGSSVNVSTAKFILRVPGSLALVPGYTIRNCEFNT